MSGIRKFRSFSNSRMSSPMSIGFKSGNYVLKRNLAGVEYVRPSWNSTESIFRFLPTWNAQTQSWDPCRVSESDGRYGPWQVCFEAVRNFGDPGVTMLLCDGTDDSYDPYHQNPCWLLYRAIKDACDRKQGKSEWYPLLQKGTGRAAALQRPGEILLAQALVFRHKSKNTFGPGRPPLGFDQGDPTIVVELSKSAAQAMFAALDARNEDYEGLDPDDPNSFKHPDITGIDKGEFVHFYQLGFDPREKSEEAQQGFDPYSAKSGHGLMQPRSNKEDIGFGSFITRTLDGSPKGITASLKGHEKKVRQKVRAWSDILNFPSDIEQAHLINKIFPPTAIYYAFNDDHPDWVLDETKDLALGRKRVNVPGGVPVSREADVAVHPDNSDPFGDPDPSEEVYEVPTNDGVDENVVPSHDLRDGAEEKKSNDDDLLSSGNINDAMAAMERARLRARARKPSIAE